MSKITVTRKQMDAIKRQRDEYKESLKSVLYHLKMKNFCTTSEVINIMSEEQIVLAWHGYAEVELEYVSFDEAMKAHDSGDGINFHPEEGSKVPVTFKITLKHCCISDYSLNDLRKGKWSIEGDNK